MKIKHLEKYFLVLALILFVLSFLIFSSQPPKVSTLDRRGELFSSRSKAGEKYFIFGKELSMMPGDSIYLSDQEDEQAESLEIKKILLPSRELVEFETDSGTITGTARQEIILEKNWRSLPGVFTVRQGNDTLQIKLSEIKLTKGKLWLAIDTDLDTLNDPESVVSFYQKSTSDPMDQNLPERQKWLSPNTDENETVYDLFTPPIIYIHNGELTTRLPEKEVVEEKLEPFGLTLVDVIKTAYPLRLKSWVGNTPYFEDRANIGEGDGEITRNRVEVGKTYKRVTNRKPGQPSLEICESNDSEKMFTVQYFTVQQYRNPETGGLRPVGRAMVKDHRSDGEPFEINTLMTEVFAGNFTIKFRASLPGLSSKEFNIESSQTNATFEYGGRKYLVSDIDLKTKSVKVTKQDPRMTQDSSQTFPFDL